MLHFKTLALVYKHLHSGFPKYFTPYLTQAVCVYNTNTANLTEIIKGSTDSHWLVDYLSWRSIDGPTTACSMGVSLTR